MQNNIRFGVVLRQTFFFFMMALQTAVFASAAAGWQSIPEIKLEAGPINEFSDRIGSMIRLQWKGRNLELRKDWPEVDVDAELEKQIQEWVDRGLDCDRAERFAARRGEKQIDDPLQRAFNSLANGIGSSRSRSGGGDSYRTIFSNANIGGMCRTHGESVQIEFTEYQNSHLRFVFNDPEDNRLSVIVLSDDLMFEFRQQIDGQIRVAIITDEPYLYTAKDYKSLVEDESQMMQEVVYPLFAHLGIVVPYSIHSPEIKMAVLTQLTARADEDSSRAQEFLVALESVNQIDRDNAYARLGEGFEFWESAIKDFSEEEAISSTTKKLIEQLISEAENHQARIFITEHKLLESPSFLIDLLEGRSETEKGLIAAQLEQNTGQEFGTDRQRWQEWLRNR